MHNHLPSTKGKASAKPPSKKDRAVALFLMGIDQIDEIAHITETKPSYIASVLQQAGLIRGYFDLYTSTSDPMNVYSHYFGGKLGFKTQKIAQKSVELIERLYEQFEINRDRAGQHHALSMALAMFNRARWTNKKQEAALFRNWLLHKLEDFS